jgi:YHS domain-containing protein
VFRVLRAVVVAVAAVLFPPFEALAEDEKAVCLVCHVDEGTNAPEAVHATRSYQRRIYRFCSDRCAGIFDENPRKYVEAAIATPADSVFHGGLFSSVSSAPT